MESTLQKPALVAGKNTPNAETGDGPEAWGWAAATGVLWGLAYYFWRRLQAPR